MHTRTRKKVYEHTQSRPCGGTNANMYQATSAGGHTLECTHRHTYTCLPGLKRYKPDTEGRGTVPGEYSAELTAGELAD